MKKWGEGIKELLFAYVCFVYERSRGREGLLEGGRECKYSIGLILGYIFMMCM